MQSLQLTFNDVNNTFCKAFFLFFLLVFFIYYLSFIFPSSYCFLITYFFSFFPFFPFYFPLLVVSSSLSSKDNSKLCSKMKDQINIFCCLLAWKNMARSNSSQHANIRIKAFIVLEYNSLIHFLGLVLLCTSCLFDQRCNEYYKANKLLEKVFLFFILTYYYCSLIWNASHFLDAYQLSFLSVLVHGHPFAHAHPFLS